MGKNPHHHELAEYITKFAPELPLTVFVADSKKLYVDDYGDVPVAKEIEWDLLVEKNAKDFDKSTVFEIKEVKKNE
jgi:hypothetical protein